MPRKVLIAIILLAIGVAVWWHFRPSPPIRNITHGPGPIIAFGDSLTQGIGAREDRNYVALLSKRFHRPIINKGVGGNTISDARARLKADVLAQKPSIVIVFLGGNDILRQFDLKASFGELTDMVEDIQATGALVIIVGLNGMFPFSGYSKYYKKVAADTHSLYVDDVMSGILGDRKLMSDQIHPNALGYEIVAERIGNALEPYIQ